MKWIILMYRIYFFVFLLLQLITSTRAQAQYLEAAKAVYQEYSDRQKNGAIESQFANMISTIREGVNKIMDRLNTDVLTDARSRINWARSFGHLSDPTNRSNLNQAMQLSLGRLEDILSGTVEANFQTRATALEVSALIGPWILISLAPDLSEEFEEQADRLINLFKRHLEYRVDDNCDIYWIFGQKLQQSYGIRYIHPRLCDVIRSDHNPRKGECSDGGPVFRPSQCWSEGRFALTLPEYRERVKRDIVTVPGYQALADIVPLLERVRDRNHVNRLFKECGQRKTGEDLDIWVNHLRRIGTEEFDRSVSETCHR